MLEPNTHPRLNGAMPVSRRKIIVIEDEPDIRELIEYNLTREGFAVATAADGENGLERVRREGARKTRIYCCRQQ